jgi:translocation-and-assembly-module (TAM) inner membrane subunit TamB-like protein/AsmA-like protein
MSRPRRIARTLLKVVLITIAIALIAIVAGLAALQTRWAKGSLRDILVRQANQNLTATLEIGGIEGSLFRGVELTNIRLARPGESLITIDRVSVSYSVRELVEEGVFIRSLRLVRPHVVVQREPDGRWNMAALVKRAVRQGERSGPARPIRIEQIEIVDGDVTIRDPLPLGFARAPRRYASLNASFSFAYEPVEWRLDFTNASWDGAGPDITMKRLAGTIANGQRGLVFDRLSVETVSSAFTVTGRVVRSTSPATLDLRVKAERFAFQEWSGLVGGLKNIAVDAAFDVTLHGPLSHMATDLTLHSNGGNIAGAFVLNTTVPGSHGAGRVSVERLNLARWLNRADRPSDITGRVGFDLDLQLGRAGGFPRGAYTFDGSHAEFMEYGADDVHARGRITATETLIAEATGLAYGARIRVESGSIGIASPYPYRFQGTAAGVDLRDIPRTIPVPHVDSTLAFDYDVTGRFSSPFIVGRARFADSEFLGAAIAAGTTGTIDTSSRPTRYSGEGDLAAVVLQRFGRDLEIEWLQDPRWSGTIAGHFKVEGTVTETAVMTLTGGGHITRGSMFDGTLSDADVSIDITRGSLHASYDGRFNGIDPAIPFADPRMAASLTGSGSVRISAPELLIRDIALTDYAVDGQLMLTDSTVRGIHLDAGSVAARLADGLLIVEDARARGAAIEAIGAGEIALTPTGSSRFDYDVVRADLPLFKDLLGRSVGGQIATKGRLEGPGDRLRLAGEATITRLDVGGIEALTTSGKYDATIPTGAPADTLAHVVGEATFLRLFNQELRNTAGTVTYDAGRLTVDLALTSSDGLAGGVKGELALHSDRQGVDFSALTLTVADTSWRLVPDDRPASVSWSDEGIRLTPMAFVDAENGTQRIELSGTWREDGRGALTVNARRVFLDPFSALIGRSEAATSGPALYGGLANIDATITGTRERPIVKARFDIADGRIRRLAYERLAGRVDYTDNFFDVDLRLDQAPGIWLTATGSAPLALIDSRRPDGPIDLAVKSSTVGLGIVEGLTDALRDVTGDLQVNVVATGTSRDPHFTGTVEVANAAFVVTASGVPYRNGVAAIQLAQDRVTVDRFRLEDSRGRALELRGSLGTHELRVGDLAIDATARRFEVLRNEFGSVEVDAALNLRGQFESPQVTGTVTVVGGEMKVDEILDRVLLAPYATQAATGALPTGAGALNPWNRLGVDVELHVPGTLRMTGENVQVSSGTPLGLGSFNLRVIGDLYLYKDPNQPMYVTGSFDSVRGTYVFQGRRFDLNPVSSINFRGDLNPEIYISVSRTISGVDTRVTISGPLREPELQLASTPPLESSDILSLIVFGTSTNELTAEQQRELAVRAGTLAAGFLAAPLISAIERSLGLEILEIEGPSGPGAGARVTVGDELAPGLVARFSRQFGQDEYDEATIEYQLSRLFRIRATFSDAGVLVTRSLFRRVERAGIDLLLFFSF